DIVSATPEGYRKTASAYDPQVFGVVSRKPALYLSDTTSPEDIPVISVGQVQVRVSSVNGSIKSGDFVTSSDIPGVGQRATDNGFVLGTADSDYSSNDPKKIGTILVTLHPHFAKLSNDITRNIWSTFNLGYTAALESPLGFVRYVIAGVITLFSFFFGFRFFAKSSNRGVEAIGRNPLASKAILLSVFINSVVTIAIMFFGVAIAYLILVL
ncbi:MAG: hypothetical protein H0W89_07500, partial [Candidatus Levybacteria bacterium]|nr:hypothetical protein [Candidatus Levybacteria bacterium]